MFWFSDWFPLPVSTLLHLCWVPVVFMGSEKYPSENGFDAFLKKHGGSDNASTDCERTVFQFDVQRKSFKEALDRWGRMSVCFTTSWEVDFSSRWFRFWSTQQTAKKEKKTKKSTKRFRHYCSQLSQAFHKPVGKLGVNTLQSSQSQLASFKLTKSNSIIQCRSPGIYLKTNQLLSAVCISLHLIASLWPVSWSLIIVSVSHHPRRWAQFFICPLMIRDAIDREVEAVDSGESRCLWATVLRAEKLNSDSPRGALSHASDRHLFLSSWVFPVLLLSFRVPAG